MGKRSRIAASSPNAGAPYADETTWSATCDWTAPTISKQDAVTCEEWPASYSGIDCTLRVNTQQGGDRLRERETMCKFRGLLDLEEIRRLDEGLANYSEHLHPLLQPQKAIR